MRYVGLLICFVLLVDAAEQRRRSAGSIGALQGLFAAGVIVRVSVAVGPATILARLA